MSITTLSLRNLFPFTMFFTSNASMRVIDSVTGLNHRTGHSELLAFDLMRRRSWPNAPRSTPGRRPAVAAGRGSGARHCCPRRAPPCHRECRNRTRPEPPDCCLVDDALFDQEGLDGLDSEGQLVRRSRTMVIVAHVPSFREMAVRRDFPVETVLFGDPRFQHHFPPRRCATEFGKARKSATTNNSDRREAVAQTECRRFCRLARIARCDEAAFLARFVRREPLARDSKLDRSHRVVKGQALSALATGQKQACSGCADLILHSVQW